MIIGITIFVYSCILLCITMILQIRSIAFETETETLIIPSNRPYLKSYEFSEIPKIIWTYWDGPTIPESVEACVESWKKHNPDHRVIILNKNNLREYTETDIYSFKFATTKQRTSDFVRLCVLEEHGGTWTDATIFMNEPLDNSKTVFEFIGYYLNGFTRDMRYPVIESWFFRCRPRSDFITKWKDCFIQINNFDTVMDYVKYMEDNVDLQNINSKEYLSIHLAAQYVLQHERIDMSRLKLLAAEDGPYKYIVDSKWDTPAAIDQLSDYTNQPIIKFRGPERNQIDKLKINLEEVLKD